MGLSKEFQEELRSYGFLGTLQFLRALVLGPPPTGLSKPLQEEADRYYCNASGIFDKLQFCGRVVFLAFFYLLAFVGTPLGEKRRHAPLPATAETTIDDLTVDLRLGRFVSRSLDKRKLGFPPLELSDLQAEALALLEVGVDLRLREHQLAYLLSVNEETLRSTVNTLRELRLCELTEYSDHPMGNYYRITNLGRDMLREWIRWKFGERELAPLPQAFEERQKLIDNMRRQREHLQQQIKERILRDLPLGEERRRAPQVAVAPSLPSRREGAMDDLEIVERGQNIYEREFKAKFEATHWGKWLIINILTRDYVLANTLNEADAEFKKRFPNAPGYALEIGRPIFA